MPAKQVLIVEDERPIREMIAFGLKRAGFDVREAEDSRAARAALADKRPDLILVDASHAKQFQIQPGSSGAAPVVLPVAYMMDGSAVAAAYQPASCVTVVDDHKGANVLKAVEHASLVEKRTGMIAEIIVDDDEPVDAIRKPVARDSAIKSLVLAAGSGRGGPGPLVSRLAKGRPLSERPIAVTVIPGNLTDRQLDEMGGFMG